MHCKITHIFCTALFSNEKYYHIDYLSVYVDSDAVRLYLAGKASGWHAGVFSVDSDFRRCE